MVKWQKLTVTFDKKVRASSYQIDTGNEIETTHAVTLAYNPRKKDAS